MAGISIVLLAVGYRALGPKGHILLQQREAEKHRLEREVRDLTVQHVRLSSDVDQLKKADPQTMERLARQELRLAKPGETIYVLPPAPPKR